MLIAKVLLLLLLLLFVTDREKRWRQNYDSGNEDNHRTLWSRRSVR